MINRFSIGTARKKLLKVGSEFDSVTGVFEFDFGEDNLAAKRKVCLSLGVLTLLGTT